jgi:hypothetical protein
MTQNTNYYGSDYANYVIANPDGSGTYVNAGANPDLSQYNATAAPTSWGTRATGTYILTLKPPPAAMLPPLVPTFLKIGATGTTVGSTIVMAYGTCRLGGQVIWGTGIDASSDPTATSYATFMSAFCEPADWSEPIRIQKLWANGTLFYDFAAGGVLTVANISSSDQAAIAASVATMTLHLGGPGELPDPTMEEALGAGNVPANRGLRTIVFTDFPLSISNNDFPVISCLFQRTDTTLVSVQTALEKIVERYIYRAGVDISIDVVDIPDDCYGVTLSDSGSMLDVLTRHKDIYNYQIIDGNPIQIVRRAVNSDLVIDLEVTEEECLRTGGSPAIQLSRVDPTTLPIKVDFSYIDPDVDFDVRVQQALHEGTQTSTVNLSIQSAFITDATTSRSLAFDILYQQRAKGLHLVFELDTVEPEADDIISVTTVEGDQYVVLVENQTHTKSRSAGINGLALLTVAGADVAGDGGRNGGVLGKRRFPAEVLLADFTVTASNFYTAYEFPHIVAVDGYPSPQLRLSTTRWKDLGAADLTGSGWGADSSALFPGTMFEDDDYVYWIAFSYLVISRLSKTLSTVGSVETMTISEGFYNGGSPDNENFWGTYGLCYRDGKLYVPWGGGGKFNGASIASTDTKLVVVDIAAWTRPRGRSMTSIASSQATSLRSLSRSTSSTTARSSSPVRSCTPGRRRSAPGTSRRACPT